MVQPRFNSGSSISVQATNHLLRRVFSWMFVGLSLTAIIAFFLSQNPRVPLYFAQHPGVLITLLIVEVALVFLLSLLIRKMSVFFATFAFFLYAALNGVTLTLILSYFNLGTITTAFAVSAGMFAAAAIFGYVTRMDLSKLGFIALMALIGLLLATVVNIFLHNTMLELIISYVGVIIFTVLTAFDMQKIKQMSYTVSGDENSITKLAILGALTLYLDFINMFLYLLRIFGSNDD